MSCVIRKRTDYIKERVKIYSKELEVKKEVLSIKKIDAKNAKIKKYLESTDISVDQVNDLLEIILNSLLSKIIVYSLKKLANGDVRTLFRMIRIALSSGYIYPEERRAKYNKVQIYDFVRALMLGNNIFYNPKDSFILNLFDNEDPTKEGNNLIRMRVLQAVSVFGEHVETKDVVAFMISIGYVKEDVDIVIKKFLLAGLIGSPINEPINSDIPLYDTKVNKYNVTCLRLTQCGRYYKDELIKEMRYIEEIQYATYASKKHYDTICSYYRMDSLSRYHGQMSVESRFKATEKFFDYLKEQEDIEISKVKNMGDYDKLGEPITDILRRTYSESQSRIRLSLLDEE